MTAKRCCPALAMIALLGCSTPTASSTVFGNSPLELVDGTGSTTDAGALRFYASSVQTFGGIGVAVRLVNVSAKDTSISWVGCHPHVRLYLTATGGTPAYDESGLCIADPIVVLLRPGDERPMLEIIGADSVAAKLSPGRYYVRLTTIYLAGAELPAGVIDRP